MDRATRYTGSGSGSFSPRMRGWTVSLLKLPVGELVFPAHAGMDRSTLLARQRYPRFPRACGDGPFFYYGVCLVCLFSPRMRGWTDERPEGLARIPVFPAHAGMDR